MSSYCIHLFTRDFRIRDNLGLIAASQNFDHIIPVFIFDDRQVNPQTNPYYNANVIEFMLQALSSLSIILDHKLRCYYGYDYISALRDVPEIDSVSGITMCADVTPFARQRASEISELCKEKGIAFIEQEDYNLAGPTVGIKHDSQQNPIGTQLLPDEYYLNKPYKTRHHFLKNISPITEPTSFKVPSEKFVASSSGYFIRQIKYQILENISLSIGNACRYRAFMLLRSFDINEYSKHKQDPSKQVTTGLSPFLKFGLISIREVASHTTEGDSLRNELLFRDFFCSLSFHFPSPLMDWTSRLRNEDYEWTASEEKISNLFSANTEYDYLNQRIQELYSTGRIHNRDRMYLAVYLHDHDIDWKWGEYLFATTLIDYDQSVNHWNWSWHSKQGVNNQWPGKKINLDKHISQRPL